MPRNEDRNDVRKMSEYIDAAKLKNQITDLKKAVHCSNSDYLNGYISALSAVEGMIAETPTADVVKVVRCKDCGSYNKHYGECTRNGSHLGEDGFCSYGAKMDKH